MQNIEKKLAIYTLIGYVLWLVLSMIVLLFDFAYIFSLGFAAFYMVLIFGIQLCTIFLLKNFSSINPRYFYLLGFVVGYIWLIILFWLSRNSLPFVTSFHLIHNKEAIWYGLAQYFFSNLLMSVIAMMRVKT